MQGESELTMNKRIIAYITATAMFISCNSGKNNEQGGEQPVFSDDTVSAVSVAPERKSATEHAATDGHTPENSLDWAGTYKGMLPCADCEGIETEITLKADKTYSISRRYLGKKTDPFTAAGNFAWKDGVRIKLENISSGPSEYVVGEGQLTQLDMEGKLVKGLVAKKYKLTKIN